MLMSVHDGGRVANRLRHRGGPERSARRGITFDPKIKITIQRISFWKLPINIFGQM